ncbi:alternate-type signal peptide domain-containing protein [Microbacterium esteraromaticum]|nr:alternate-type signal peptide domain-containing protein [Microbacterium esteraromaticum]
MNKTTKGTIAASAAVLLLLGTGGSLAYWNSTADLGGQTISAGQLKVEPAGSPAWTIKHTSGAATIVADIAAVKLVPGDTVEYTGKFNITAQGQNLAFSVNLAKGSIAAATTGNAAANAALVTRLTNNATFAVDGVAVTGSTFTINEPTADENGVKTHAVTVTATIGWPFGNSASPASDNPAQLGAVSLKDFALNIQQADASAPVTP